MLSLVQATDNYTDAQVLIRFAESIRPDLWAAMIILLPLLAVILLASGQVWAWCLIGAALALYLRRHGPRWWPGRR